jgi:shikimate 5-dehydrogenase
MFAAMTTAVASHALASSRARDRLYFVGISTSGSLIMTIFPAWARHLGLDASVTGIDLPPVSSRDVYRRCVDSIVADPAARGALITAHKAAVYEAASDMFTSLDHYAVLCREISNLLVRDGERRGLAKDPVTARLALRHMLGPDYWREPGRETICFGAGGAGIAILVALLSQQVPPARFVLVDNDPGRLDVAREVVRRLDGACAVELLGHTEAIRNDALLAAAPSGSLIINATGLGKDRPGSPLTGHAMFPREAVVWDLNYRGELDFLRLAERQAAGRGLRTHDGWRYFLHGWTDVVADVFGVPLSEDLFSELAGIAANCAPERPAGAG